MTVLGIVVFTVASGIFGAIWGWFTVGTWAGVAAGWVIASVVGGACCFSMRSRDSRS